MKSLTPTDGNGPLLGNGPLPFRLHRRNIYILPTRFGALFIVILVGMLIGSVNYNNNLGFLLTFLLAGIAFVGLFQTYFELMGLTVDAAASEPVFAGDIATVQVRVKSGRRRRSSLQFFFRKKAPETIQLSARGDVLVGVTVPTEKRGLLDPGALTIDSRYPLGLFRAWARIMPGTVGLVYPKPLASQLNGERLQGGDDSHSRQSIPGVEDFKGLSPYQPGDPPQRIFWKAFSKGQGLFTKSFTGPAGDVLLLSMDRTGGWDEERKLSKLCHQVLAAARRQIPFGLQIGGRMIPPGKGMHHRHNCLKALALYGSLGRNGR